MPQWSAERRARPAHGRAPRLQSADLLSACRRSAPSPSGEARKRDGDWAPKQTPGTMTLGCLTIESVMAGAGREAQASCPRRAKRGRGTSAKMETQRSGRVFILSDSLFSHRCRMFDPKRTFSEAFGASATVASNDKVKLRHLKLVRVGCFCWRVVPSKSDMIFAPCRRCLLPQIGIVCRRLLGRTSAGRTENRDRRD